MYYTKTIDSPVGKLRLISSETGLCAVSWHTNSIKSTIPTTVIEQNDHPILKQTEQQLEEYFMGTRKQFFIPLDTPYGTPFQKKVWQALRTIPYGELRTYAQQAVLIDNPKAVRAVGSANGKNPLPIIVPCHRVVASNGGLGGFTGGLSIKETLLAIEKKYKDSVAA